MVVAVLEIALILKSLMFKLGTAIVNQDMSEMLVGNVDQDVPLERLGMVLTAYVQLVMQNMEVANYAQLTHFLILPGQAAFAQIQIKYLFLILFHVLLALSTPNLMLT